MGYYVNPMTQPKEQWVLENKVDGPYGSAPTMPSKDNDKVLLCLVNNGPFTALGVVYNEREYKDFSDRSDTRPKLWFYVNKADLEAVDPTLYQRYMT